MNKLIIVFGVIMATCTSRYSDIDLSSIDKSPSILAKATNVCTSAYIVVADSLYASTSPDDPYRDNEVTIIVDRKADHVALQPFVGKPVRICGKMQAEISCWKANHVCAPVSHPVHLKVMRSVNFK